MEIFGISAGMRKHTIAILSTVGLLLTSAVNVWAQPEILKPVPLVMVSDIDDTIRVSQVLDRAQYVANAPLTENVFRGMPELFQILQANYPRMPVIYLTNAEANSMTASHTKFIGDNGFPEGHLLLRRNPNDANHKIMRLREIIKATQPRVMILLGDNGESDSLVFDQLKKEFPQIIMLNYIRQLYYTQAQKQIGQALLPGQMGFVTPIEIMIDLHAKRLVSVPQVQAFVDLVAPEVIQVAAMEDEQGRRGELSFPRWQDCRDFKWPPGIDAMFAEIQRDGLLKAIKARVQTRCAKPGRIN